MEQNSQKEKAVKTNSFSVGWAKLKSMKARDWLNFFLDNIIIFLLIVFVAVVAIIAAYYKTPSVDIFSVAYIVSILQETSKILFLALGVGGIIILTGTDLSAGRIVGFTAVFAAALMQLETELDPVDGSGAAAKVFPGLGVFPIYVVIPIVMIIGGIFGIINGFFVSKFKLHPFIVTLATSLMIYGTTVIMGGTGGIVARTTDDFINFSAYNINFFGRPLGIYVFIAIGATILTWFLWNYTTLGKHMYAVGSNPEAAKVSGINVNKTIILVFMYAGLLYGFAGFLYGSSAGAPKVIVGEGLELNAIAACVIGGVSFIGGIGKIRGIIVGALILTYLDKGLTTIGFTDPWIKVIKGALILLAVVLDMRRYVVKR